MENLTTDSRPGIRFLVLGYVTTMETRVVEPKTI